MMDVAVPQIGLWRAKEPTYHNGPSADDGDGASASTGSSVVSQLIDQWEERSATSSSQKGFQSVSTVHRKNGGLASSITSSSFVAGVPVPPTRSYPNQKLYGMKRSAGSTASSTTSGELSAVLDGEAGKDENYGEWEHGVKIEASRGDADGEFDKKNADAEKVKRLKEELRRRHELLGRSKSEEVTIPGRTQGEGPEKLSKGEEATNPVKSNNSMERPAELASFLQSPNGMNWEELVRSMKKQRREPLLDKTIEVVHDEDDDVSELGSREGNRHSGDYRKDWIHDHDGDGGGGANILIRREGEQDGWSNCSSLSSKSLDGGLPCHARRRAVKGKKLRGSGREKISGKAVGEGRPRPPANEAKAQLRHRSKRRPIGEGSPDKVGNGSERALEGALRSPPRSKSLSRDGLERRIEMVITGQMMEEAQGASPTRKKPATADEERIADHCPATSPKLSPWRGSLAKKKTSKNIPAITPPHRDRRRGSSRRGKGSLGSITPNPGSPKPLLGSAGSAFSPVQSTTPSTANETLHSRSRSGRSEASLTSPERAVGEEGEASTPSGRESTFSPIEQHEMSSPERQQQGQAPVTSPQPVTPKARRSTAPTSDDPVVVSVAARRRAARQRRYGSPSDPPLLVITYSDDADDQAPEEDGKQPERRPLEMGKNDGNNAQAGGIEEFAIFPADPLETVDANDGGLGQAMQPTNELKCTATTTASTMPSSSHNDDKLKSRSSAAVREDEEEVTSTTTAEGAGAPNLTVLPRSLSVNRRAPTCWQITRHRILPTRGEF